MFGLLDDRDRLRISLCLHSNSFLDRRSLKRAEGEFDLFITSDQNIRYQQNLAWRRIAILELSTNDIGRIQAASVLIQDAIDKIQSNEFKQYPPRFRRFLKNGTDPSR